MVEQQTADNNWLVKWWTNLKNTKKNYQKVRASPFASLTLALKARKLIIAGLIPWLLYMTYSMVTRIHANGIAGTFQRIIMIGMMGYIIWRIYATIPAAKKQIEYYKKFPHTINYCPTNTKETIDEILAKVESNAEKKLKEEEVKQCLEKEKKQ